MKEFSFPIWPLKYILEKETLQTETAVLSEIIDSFCGIANSNNMGTGTTDSDIAMAIGNLALTNGNAANDLRSILTKEKCTQGMAAYLETFENGTLVSLAQTVGDGGQYINVLRKKFDADAANWVWNVETAQQKIREVILEYQIIVESNKIISKSISYDATIREWCDKCGYIRISYAAAKNYLDELGPFLGMLYTCLLYTSIIKNWIFWDLTGIGIMQRMTPTHICGRRPTIISTEAGRLPRQKVGVFTQHLKSSFWMTQNQMDNLSALLISLQWLKRTGICWRNWLRKQLKKYITLM